MSQEVKVLAMKLNELSLILGPPMVEGNNQLLQTCPLTMAFIGVHRDMEGVIH